MGILLATPLLPLFYVRELNASNAWIGLINTVQACLLLFGYFWWPRVARAHSSRVVLLWTTLGLSIYPALVAVSHDVATVALPDRLASIFQAGIDLVFFDELMKTIPIQYSATFVSIAQSARKSCRGHRADGGALPLLHGLGVRMALGASSLVRFAGFAFFARRKKA